MQRLLSKIKQMFTISFDKAVVLKKPAFYTKDILVSNCIEVGDFTYGEPRVLHWGENAKLKIGKYCSIAEEVKIFLGGNHRTDWISTYPFNSIPDFNNVANMIKGHPVTNGDVIIGNDVWIGWGAVIMSGVKIGNGAVIGAYSLVTKNVEPYEIVAGNPAKHIKYRFDKDSIEKLLQINWWDWTESEIKNNVGLLSSDNLQAFFK